MDNVRIFHKCRIQPNTQFATYSMAEAGLGISITAPANLSLAAKMFFEFIQTYPVRNLWKTSLPASSPTKQSIFKGRKKS